MYVVPDIKTLFTLLFHFILVLKFVCLDSKTFKWSFLFSIGTLRGSSVCIKTCSARIRSCLGAMSAWILCSHAQFGTFFVALATLWRHQVLLYAHSKCVGELLKVHSKYRELLFFFLSCRRLEQHGQPSWCKSSSSRRIFNGHRAD